MIQKRIGKTFVFLHEQRSSRHGPIAGHLFVVEEQRQELESDDIDAPWLRHFLRGVYEAQLRKKSVMVVVVALNELMRFAV